MSENKNKNSYPPRIPTYFDNRYTTWLVCDPTARIVRAILIYFLYFFYCCSNPANTRRVWRTIKNHLFFFFHFKIRINIITRLTCGTFTFTVCRCTHINYEKHLSTSSRFKEGIPRICTIYAISFPLR